MNFTTLGINATSLLNSKFRTVSILVGLHNDVIDVLQDSLPIPLVPDAHLLGGVIPIVRQQFKRPDLASLGAFSSVCTSFMFSTYIIIVLLQTTTRLQSTVIFLTTDPSLLIPRDANTATLRLYTQIDYSDWRFLVEYREKSVLAGISSVGGFWTVVNGMYAVIFGMSLSYLLFGGRLALLYVVTG